ncbi:hypothetical protein [Romboutsia sp.]|uniref:hypothetical protein n=1 Tax=Romboutsia sp. TaxID=1965302 RepID=UPI003F3B1FCA
MNKKLAKTILAVTITSMAVIIVSLEIFNKEDYKLIDINGNKEEIEDMVVAYQERQGLYKTTQVNISKDNIDVENYCKEMPRNLSLSSFNKNNRDVLETAYYEEGSYKDDKSIINIQVDIDYDYYKLDTKKIKYEAYIKEKDLETNKTIEKIISLESNFEYHQDADIWNFAAPIKYNGEVYLAMTSTMKSSTTDEVEDDSKTGCFIEIYKLDMKNKTSQIIFSERVSEPSQEYNINGVFVNKNSFYFIKEIRDKNEINVKSELLEYDLETKKLTSIEMFKDDLYYKDFNDLSYESRNSDVSGRSPFRYQLEDNKVNFIKNIYDSSKKEINIYINTMDLETKNIIYDNEKYTIKLDNPSFKYKIEDVNNYGIRKFRNINDKLYIVLSAYSDGNSIISPTSSTNYLFIVDEETKETVYIGELPKEKGEYENISILKEDEL